MLVLLLSIGTDRFDLYSEPDDAPAPPAAGEGRVRRWIHAAAVRWRALEEAARSGASSGWFARWRDRIVCRLAETVAEQRTIWGLTDTESATLLFPSTLDQGSARAALDRVLGHARRRHLIWCVVNTLGFGAGALLTPIPGPNVVAYYFAFRAVGHLQSWRGARHGLMRVAWTLQPDDALSELAALARVSRDIRRPRVEAIARELQLPRLSTFFDRLVA